MSAPIKIALLGGGTVGSAVANLLVQNSADLAARIGRPIELVGIAVRDASKERSGIAQQLLTTDAQALASSGADIVVEVIGGIEPAKTLIETALKNGSSVVTANKALLAVHGSELHELAVANGVDLFYEAAVAGAIPLLRPLRESLAGDKVRKVLGIVNGTTNFILSKMYDDGADYADVLAQAQALGYAEADPTADVEGFDSAAKAAILAGLAFHSKVTIEDVAREGMSQVSALDIAAAKSLGCVIKLLAIAELTEDESGIIVRVHPTMIPASHPLASVRDAFNAVFVEAKAAGQVMFYGRGAGGEPTASSVLGDIVAAARNKVAGSVDPGQSSYAELKIHGIGEAKTSYYLNLLVADESGVLAAISNEFARHGVSIQAVRQDEVGEAASLIIRTHVAADQDLQATVESLRNMPQVRDVLGVMRVESGVSS
ncbi:MAG: homoserine dehydrogenase [Actinomycetales bacterium]|nr:homoserine dehydrogenase [Actinomycetales bacterium]